MDVANGNTRIPYDELGEGRPLHMLHGWPSDHRHKVADFGPRPSLRLR